MRALFLALSLLAAAPAAADVIDSEARVGAIFDGTTRINGVFVGTTTILDQKPPEGVPATISDWGVTAGTIKQRRLTINRNTITSSGLVIRMSATTTGSNSWEIWRNYGTGHNVAAVGVGTSPSTTESLTPDFHPPAAGWTYRLHAYATDANGADADDTITVRVITAPTLTAFSATAPEGGSTAPFLNRQCSWLTWTATPGDPPAVWNMTQAGRVITNLPSSGRLTPEYGRATGNNRQRVCVTAGSNLISTLTLGGRNEAGNVSRAVVITWAGG